MLPFAMTVKVFARREFCGRRTTFILQLSCGRCVYGEARPAHRRT